MAQEQPSDEQYEDDEYEEEEGEEEEYEEEDGEEEGDESGAKATGKDVSGEAEGQGEGEAGEEEAEEGEEEEEEEEEEAQPWAGLARLPERASVLPLLQELKEAGRKSVTILLLGKSGVGKSSTVNSFLREPAVRAQPFKLQPDSETTTVVTRQVAAGVPEVDGLRVRLIDTCGLEDQEVGDTVNYAALQRIAEDLRSTPVDVVLYVDRLDLYRVEPLDKSIVQAVSDTFGPAIWKRAALVLTHANMTLTPPGTTYDSFAQRRVRALRAAVRSTCNPLLVRPALHALLVENSESCPTDAQGERVLPDGSPWLVGLAEEVADVALAHKKPYKWHPRMQRKANNRLKWLLPVVVVGQWLLWKRVLQPLLREDEAADDAHDDEVWRLRARERRRLGIGAPLKPSRDTLRRLELMYDEE